jgi:hypothetical protein
MQVAAGTTKLKLSRIWQKLRLPIISLFIFYNTAALVLWTCLPFPLYWHILPYVRPYICYLGFWNKWNMFSHPKNWNMYLTANVITSNGQIIEWDFPRLDKMDYLARYQKEGYRKWAHEYIDESQYSFACPDACRFILRQMPQGAARPIKVELVRHWSWIQPPVGHGDALPPGEFKTTFFTYDVKPEDLK